MAKLSEAILNFIKTEDETHSFSVTSEGGETKTQVDGAAPILCFFLMLALLDHGYTEAHFMQAMGQAESYRKFRDSLSANER